MNFFLPIIFTAFFTTSINADTLKPFVSDGCSAFPDGTFEQNELWLSCCYEHDFAYWKGGTYKQRIESDRKLKSCVSKAGELEIALLMMAGVRVGGSPFFPTPFRWGYGWSYPKLYNQLNKSELLQIKNLTGNQNILAPNKN